MEILHSIIVGEGKPLLILHGFLGMSDNWKTLGNGFSEDYQVHLIDQRNHGRSFHTDDFSYDLMMEDLLHYINYHRLDNIILLGHSMGGKTAMLFAVTFPNMVDKLIVGDIAPKYYPPHHQLILEALKAVDFKKVKNREEIEEIFNKYITENRITKFLLKNVYRKKKDELAYRFNLESLSRNVEEVGDDLPAFTQFKGPTLFLKGELSGYIGVDDEALIRTHFPNSKLQIISKAGHWLHAENPAVFFSKVDKFLKNH